MHENEELFGPADLDWAADELAMVAFFPHESRAAVMTLLARMCPHRRALRWLVGEVVNHIGKWPGPAELRGLLCTRFEPADGIDQWCSLPGYSAADQEAKHLADHEQRKIQDKVGGHVGEAAEFVRQLTGDRWQLAEPEGTKRGASAAKAGGGNA